MEKLCCVCCVLRIVCVVCNLCRRLGKGRSRREIAGFPWLKSHQGKAARLVSTSWDGLDGWTDG